jgi:diaminohydroxyphosphoribosylaminopyrimidine deaminase/5-amino-6-(5-phosphoribosylamino)uracil reductase
MFSPSDHEFMQRALTLAENGLNSTTPNPRVGCVVVRDSRIVGEGWHRQAGGPHAEVIALAQAAGQARGATVYVSLEPCSHFGRTPPCVNTLIEAQVGRVVAAMPDPNPLVAGRGLQTLREAGIDVRCGLLEGQARELNLGFISRMVRSRPWVRMKLAASLDGRTALPNGTSQWITDSDARGDGHRWRARACALLTGIGTVRADNPRLTVRGVESPRQPLKVLVDSRLEVNPQAQLFDEGQVLIVFAQGRPESIEALRERGAQLLECPNPQGKVDLPRLMTELGARGINELHVEAGAALNGSLIKEDCVDELLVYLAPVLLGEGAPLAQLGAVAHLDQVTRYAIHGIDRIGDGARLVLRDPQSTRF